LKTGKRSLERVPTIACAHTYGAEWIKWWAAAQPPGRDTRQWPFSRDADNGIDWCKFPANGKDGIFLAIMALSWWAPAVRFSNEIAFFEEAATDLHWVIQELIRFKTASQIPPPPPPSPRDEPDARPQPTSCPPTSSSRPPTSSSRPPVSSAGVHSHQRARGKRVVKPSWRVLANQ